MLPAGDQDEVELVLPSDQNDVELVPPVPPHPGHQQAASSVLYTTSRKHSLVLLWMGEIIVRNTFSWLKLLIRLLLLHLVGCSYYLYQWCMVTQTSNRTNLYYTVWKMKNKKDNYLKMMAIKSDILYLNWTAGSENYKWKLWIQALILVHMM